MPKGVQMYLSPNQEGPDLYLKTLSWARLNFELQSVLSQPKLPISAEIKKKLCEIGYAEEICNSPSPKEIEKLFKEGELLSCIKTGNRIVSFALKENGLSAKAFKKIEENITDAYLQVKELNTDNRLLDSSYAYTLQALAVFRP